MATLRPRYVGNKRRTPSNKVPAGADRGEDNYLKVLVAGIPAEVISVYLFIQSLMGGARAGWFWWSLGGSVIATFLWIGFATRDFGTPNARPTTSIAWRQVLIACWSMPFWAIGTVPLELGQKIAPWWSSAFAPVALALGSFFLPVLDGLLTRLGVPQDPQLSGQNSLSEAATPGAASRG